VTLTVRGAELSLFPLSDVAVPVVLGEEARELAAPAAALLVRAVGGSLEARDERLVVSFPTGS
jgi:hypothetical protein